ncbi:MAG: hypothetical protein Q9160_005338 [Pyrenula sp. 1 TL-2023]
MDPEVAQFGFTCLYEPASKEPTVDIILVHGLNGHPFKTWALSNAVTGAKHRKQKDHNKKLQKDAQGALKDRSRLKQAFTKLPHRFKATALAESHAAEDESEHGVRNVVSSTAAIVFFATPHRGGPGFASIGEVARRTASAVLMDTNPALLDALGLQTTDIQRCQESFNRIWRKYGFEVKTFREGRGLTRFNLGFANEKVAGELKLTIEGIETNRRNVSEVDDAERGQKYRAWHDGERFDKHKGFLLIKGKPGSGKSTIMRTAIKQYFAEYGRRYRLIVTFFLDAKGGILQRTALGLYRSLAYQVLKVVPALFQLILPLWKAKKQDASAAAQFGCQPAVEHHWEKAELEYFLISVFKTQLTPPIVAFIDALDECQDSYETEPISGEAREVAFFLQRLLGIASDNKILFNICLLSRSSLPFRLNNGFEVITDHHNQSDVKRYIKSRLTADIGDDARQQEALSQLTDEIVDRSSGIFSLATDAQLEKQIRRVSKGFVEVGEPVEPELFPTEPDCSSIQEHAGSLDLNSGGNRRVEVIHESVREFFIDSGFKALNASFQSREDIIAKGHSTIIRSCIRYIKIEEIDELVAPRGRDKTTSVRVHDEHLSHSIYRRESVQSFSSAGSSYSGGHRSTDLMQKHRDDDSLIGFSQENSPNLDTCVNRIDIPTSDEEKSIANSEQSTKTQVLGERDILGLFDIALHGIFTHATSALQCGADPCLILPRFHDVWDRFVYLREDFKPETSLVQCCLQLRANVLILPALELEQTSRLKQVPWLDKMAFACNCGNMEGATRILNKDTSDKVTDFSGDVAFNLEVDQFLSIPSKRNSSWLAHCEPHVLKILSLLLDIRWNNLSLGTDCTSPFHRFCGSMEPNWEAVSTLIENGIDVNIRDTNGETPLHLLMKMRNYQDDTLQISIAMVRHGADINAQDNAGNTPLHIVCNSNNSQITAFVSVLLQYGANANINDGLGETPLHLVCSSLNFRPTDIIRVLLQHGADPNANNYCAQTPLHLVCKFDGFERTAIVVQLLQHGANPNLRDVKGRTPLHYTTLNGALDTLIPMLLSAGALIDGQDGDGATPLNFTLSSVKPTETIRNVLKSLRAVSTLIDRGANTSIPTNGGELPLHAAVSEDRWNDYSEPNVRLKLARILLEKGAKINAVNEKEETALHKAVETRNVRVVRLLLQNGADPDAREWQGNMPLHKAVMQSDEGSSSKFQHLEACISALRHAGANPFMENIAG